MTSFGNVLNIHLPWWVQPLNRALLALNGLGVPVPGARVLQMKGRRTGKVRDVVITPFACEGQQYVIVGIPGSTWTANVRPSSPAELRHGRRSTAVLLTEVSDHEEKRRVMRAYPSIQPLGVYPFRIMGHVKSSDPDEWQKAASKVGMFRIDPAT